MRCFFHLVSEHEVITDVVGINVADLKAARLEAVAAAAELSTDDPEGATSWLGWRLEVANVTGNVLFRIDLATVSGGDIERAFAIRAGMQTSRPREWRDLAASPQRELFRNGEGGQDQPE
jgi:hypothetical protein